MKVVLFNEDGVKFNLDIVFYRSKLEERRQVGNKELIDTYCVVFCNSEELTRTVAYQNPKDNYNKIVGRKIALAKAIKEIGFLAWTGLQECDVPRRSMRQHIWNKFNELFKREPEIYRLRKENEELKSNLSKVEKKLNTHFSGTIRDID